MGQWEGRCVRAVPAALCYLPLLLALLASLLDFLGFFSEVSADMPARRHLLQSAKNSRLLQDGKGGELSGGFFAPQVLRTRPASRPSLQEKEVWG